LVSLLTLGLHKILELDLLFQDALVLLLNVLQEVLVRYLVVVESNHLSVLIESSGLLIVLCLLLLFSHVELLLHLNQLLKSHTFEITLVLHVQVQNGILLLLVPLNRNILVLLCIGLAIVCTVIHYANFIYIS